MFMAREHTLARAEQAAAHVLMFGRVLEPEAMAAQVDAVTPAHLTRLAEMILAQRRSAVAVLGPKAAMKAAPAFDRALFG
jgi:predicted Zn-dependent peptidase